MRKAAIEFVSHCDIKFMKPFTGALLQYEISYLLFHLEWLYNVYFKIRN